MIVARTWLDALSYADAVVIGGIATVLGPIGDLCKSMVKRAAGTKDTGRLFFAHGGMLDRIDAILFDARARVRPRIVDVGIDRRFR